MIDDEFVSVGAPLPRISAAEPAGSLCAKITWSDGRVEVIDLSAAVMSHRNYIPLRKDDALFRKMSVSPTHDSLCWPGDIELSAVWIEELAPASLGNDEFRQAMDELQFSLDGMAARLGIARRLIADYRKDKPIPPAIALATKYLLERHKKVS